MDKIILTKRQAEALENLKREGDLDDAIDVVMFKIQRGKGWINNGLEALDELSHKDILQALYVGYEVEETKEETLSIYFNDLIDKIGNNEDEDSFYYGYSLGIEKALEILEIEIEGIND